jgi:mRNA interferase YafQ
MRRIERTKTFKKDYQRAVATPKHRDLANLLPAVIALLAADTPLPEKYVDHPLRGEWKDFRDCHVKPDLVLIYRKSGTDILQLVRLGSSSSGRAVRASLHSLDDGGPEACRDASAPASLRSSPHRFATLLLRSRTRRHFPCRRSPQCCSPLCGRSSESLSPGPPPGSRPRPPFDPLRLPVATEARITLQ